MVEHFVVDDHEIDGCVHAHAHTYTLTHLPTAHVRTYYFIVGNLPHIPLGTFGNHMLSILSVENQVLLSLLECTHRKRYWLSQLAWLLKYIHLCLQKRSFC